MSECTCSFRAGISEDKVMCRAKNLTMFDSTTYHPCTPDTCTLWQDHLAIVQMQRHMPCEHLKLVGIKNVENCSECISCGALIHTPLVTEMENENE